MPVKKSTAKKAAPPVVNRELLERWAKEAPTVQVLEVIEALSAALRRKEQGNED